MDIKFSKGDRVIAIDKYDGNSRIVGITGTVISSAGSMISVEFDEDVGGHDLTGKCRYGYGWRVPAKCLDHYRQPCFADSDIVISYEEVMS